jgi:hypothetical protein
VLERFEVQVPDAQLDLLDKLDAEWAKFQVRNSPPASFEACSFRIIKAGARAAARRPG